LTFEDAEEEAEKFQQPIIGEGEEERTICLVTDGVKSRETEKT
jgi:hypothetical protein